MGSSPHFGEKSCFRYQLGLFFVSATILVPMSNLPAYGQTPPATASHVRSSISEAHVTAYQVAGNLTRRVLLFPTHVRQIPAVQCRSRRSPPHPLQSRGGAPSGY